MTKRMMTAKYVRNFNYCCCLKIQWSVTIKKRNVTRVAFELSGFGYGITTKIRISEFICQVQVYVLSS